ncbi:MAG: cell division protein [Nitrospirales bacterium]|nr:MAG: cell division protein [Nitrospirales bacterium]
MVCVEHRIGIVLLLVSWVMLFPPVVEAAEPAIRVGLVDAAQVLSIQSSDSFFLRLASGKRFHISGRVTIRMQGVGLLLNDRPVADSHLWVEGSAGTYQVRVETKRETSTSSNSAPEWVVRGPLEIQSNPSGLALINWINLEEYVAGVVSGEVGAKWPLEALKAQAVAARTYVLYKKIENQLQSFDVVAGVQDQVYHGHSVRAESVLQAVAATRGQVVTYENRPIFAAYSSTAAGPTEDALYVWALDLPYLKGVDCPFDEQAPRYDWRTSFSFDFLEQQLVKEGYDVGKIATFTPYTFTPSGRVDRVRLLHSRGEIILRGQDLRRVVGYSKIFSTQFSIESLGQEVVVVGHGAGHAVGMCQWGMREMAELGYDYQSIIRHYYPHTILLPLDRVLLTATD